MAQRVGLVVFAIFLLVPSLGFAVPGTSTRSDTVDDARIWLTTRTQTILGDSAIYCSVRIRVGSSDTGFSGGDRVKLWVYEDDTVGDDQIWYHSFTVTSAEVSSGLVDRTFNCSGSVEDDPGDHAEFYAEAEVIKDKCGTWCAYDRPETDNIEVDEVTDDAGENDDISAYAKPLGLGLTTGRISRDQDWYRFELASPAAVDVRVEHDPGVGRLDLRLFDNSGNPVRTGTDWSSMTRVDEDFLAAGTYRLRVNPRNTTGYNFYDLRLLVEPLATECFPGTTDSDACGNCGMRSRYCNELGRWTPWSGCQGQGVCVPGTLSVDECGLCGAVTSQCTDTCQWDVGGCEGSGVCDPGTTEEEYCGDGGVQERSCNGACEWGAFNVCTGSECTGRSPVSCYAGSPETEGVGECRAGSRACTNGFLGSCDEQVLPTDEVCDDGLDNDCDGWTDDQDPSCAKPGEPIGEACTAHSDCEEELDCMTAPEEPIFTDGYCGLAGCSEDAECGENGACVDFRGALFCLQLCEDDDECRDDYWCEDYGDVGVCAPLCRTNADCTDPRNPVCERFSGMCEPAPASDPTDPTDPVDPPADPVDDGSSDDPVDDGSDPASTGPVGGETPPSSSADSGPGQDDPPAGSSGEPTVESGDGQQGVPSDDGLTDNDRLDLDGDTQELLEDGTTDGQLLAEAGCACSTTRAGGANSGLLLGLVMVGLFARRRRRVR